MYLLMVLNYIYYAWWDWRMLAVIVGMSEFCRLMGILIEDLLHQGKSTRKLTVISVSVCIIFLGIFKYIELNLNMEIK